MFASNRDSGFELYLLDVATRLVTRLTISNGDTTDPAVGNR